ncbi:hypothetical protein H634G_11158 [Metarhizium anisopliae BRIP 53293]|uniref:Uncharacterized protein n=1 Tax=Metarhizium anisopliae BRIP 53293 TaxID=1291518 RepID=A0A0D9NIQ0_METAN|nr:hypothetical protein H634G_11158 [Metarhizium anisopliae BRIP 53293]
MLSRHVSGLDAAFTTGKLLPKRASVAGLIWHYVATGSSLSVSRRISSAITAFRFSATVFSQAGRQESFSKLVIENKWYHLAGMVITASSRAGSQSTHPQK